MKDEKTNILVADKPGPERDVLAAVLTKLGYQVETADSARELEDKLSSDRDFAVVILRSRLYQDRATDKARELGTANRRVILVSDDMPPGGMVGFVDLTENTLLALGVRVPEIVFATNDLVYSRKSAFRRKKRIYGGLSASFRVGETWQKGALYNLSPDGAFIETLRPPQVGETLTIRFSLPNDQEVVVPGRVTWRVGANETKGRRSPPGVGVQFVDVDEGTRALLERFVHSGGQA